MKKLIPFLIFIGIFLTTVSFSGCIGKKAECPVVVSQTEGVVITRFEPSYDLIPVGDIIGLVAEIQNRGNARARNINLTLWAHPGFLLLDKDPYKDGITRRGLADLDKTDATMDAPRLDICSAGDSQVVQWQLQAGCDPRETPLAIAVDYDYESDGWASVFIVSSEESRKTGGKFSEKGQNFPSAGPIQVIIEPLQTEPVILSRSAPNFDVRVKFKNLADGVAGIEGSGNLALVELTVQGPCRFTELNVGRDPSDDRRITWGTYPYRNQVTLRVGEQEAFKIAKLEYDDNFDNFVKDFCRINANVDYHYRVVEEVRKKVGIAGSSSQVKECRVGATCTDACRQDGFDYGRCVPEELAVSDTIPDLCGIGSDTTLICECKNFPEGPGERPVSG